MAKQESALIGPHAGAGSLRFVRDSLANDVPGRPSFTTGSGILIAPHDG